MATLKINRVNAKAVLTMSRFDQRNALDVAAATAEVCTGADGHLRTHFVRASPRARFCSGFAPLDYIPDTGATYLLPRAVGLTQNPALREETIHE